MKQSTEDHVARSEDDSEDDEDLESISLARLVEFIDPLIRNKGVLTDVPSSEVPELGHWRAQDLFFDLVTAMRDVDPTTAFGRGLASELPYTGAEMRWMMDLSKEPGIDLFTFNRMMVQRARLDMAARFKEWLIAEDDGPYAGAAEEFCLYVNQEARGVNGSDGWAAPHA